jgi:ribosomal protein L13
MCKQIAEIIKGSHKPTFRNQNPHYGDKVIVVNCERPNLTEKEAKNSKFTYHTGWIG